MSKVVKYSDKAMKAKQLDVLMHGALAGTCLAALFSIMSASSLSHAQTVAACLLSVSFPLNIFSLLCRQAFINRGSITFAKEIVLLILGIAALISGVGAIALLLFNTNATFGWLFIGSAAILYPLSCFLVYEKSP